MNCKDLINYILDNHNSQDEVLVYIDKTRAYFRPKLSTDSHLQIDEVMPESFEFDAGQFLVLNLWEEDS